MTASSPSLLRTLLPWFIAGFCALAAGWFGRLYLAANLQAEQLRTQTALTEIALKSGEHQLEAERILTRAQSGQVDLATLKIVSLTGPRNSAPDARAVIVWNPSRQEGVFVVEKLPALAADQRWELWLLESGATAKPVSAGGLDLRGGKVSRVGFKPLTGIGDVAKFIVSREKVDGARVHRSPAEIVLAGESR